MAGNSLKVDPAAVANHNQGGYNIPGKEKGPPNRGPFSFYDTDSSVFPIGYCIPKNALERNAAICSLVT